MARFLKTQKRPQPECAIKEVDAMKTNGLRILILLALALGFFLGRKAAAPKSLAGE